MLSCRKAPEFKMAAKTINRPVKSKFYPICKKLFFKFSLIHIWFRKNKKKTTRDCVENLKNRKKMVWNNDFTYREQRCLKHVFYHIKSIFHLFHYFTCFQCKSCILSYLYTLYGNYIIIKLINNTLFIINS